MNSKKTILVVDDTEENIEILIDLLSNKYNIMVALDANTGIEIANENNPNLILLDVMMPNVDGYEMCEILKQKKKTKDIPIIFITAKIDEGSIEKAYDIGAVDYVTKPFKPKELLARISIQLKLIDLVLNLENKIKQETEKRVDQEKVLMHQSRLAAIGEMMDVIAHQWTQPISVINSYITLLSFDVKMKAIDESYVENLQNKFTRQINHIMETLKEFRNFFRPAENAIEFDVKLMIKKAVNLVKDEFKLKSIKIDIHEHNSFSLNGIENEFIHLILSIVNNAKDAFFQHEISDKKISINIMENGGYNIIEIVDNAGGIPEGIIDDIFKMNITTRGNDSGTGIGLYISSLISQKYNGILSAENVDNGAKFIFKTKDESG